MTFRFPLPGTKEDWTVTQEFCRQDQGASYNHYGIDWSAYKKGATLKAPIYAAADGVVCKACFGDDYGNGTKTTSAGYVIELDHGKDSDGFYYGTRYQHMVEATKLKVGAKVKAGDIIGYVGSTGSSTGAHLHFEILKYDSKITGHSSQRGNVNPRAYIYTAQPTKTVKKYELVVAVPTYSNAANAKARKNPGKDKYGPGIFYIYTKYNDGVDGMFNITSDATGGSPGAWINPGDNVKPKQEPAKTETKPATTTSKPKEEKKETTASQEKPKKEETKKDEVKVETPVTTPKEDKVEQVAQPTTTENPIAEKDATWLGKSILEIINFIINFFSKK